MQVPNTRDWKIVAKEIVRFVGAEALFDDARPVRYSLLYDPHPMALPSSIGPYGKPGGPKLLKLREVILTSYHHNEVRGCARCYYLQIVRVKRVYMKTTKFGSMWKPCSCAVCRLGPGGARLSVGVERAHMLSSSRCLFSSSLYRK